MNEVEKLIKEIDKTPVGVLFGSSRKRYFKNRLVIIQAEQEELMDRSKKDFRAYQEYSNLDRQFKASCNKTMKEVLNEIIQYGLPSELQKKVDSFTGLSSLAHNMNASNDELKDAIRFFNAKDVKLADYESLKKQSILIEVPVFPQYMADIIDDCRKVSADPIRHFLDIYYQEGYNEVNYYFNTNNEKCYMALLTGNYTAEQKSEWVITNGSRYLEEVIWRSRRRAISKGPAFHEELWHPDKFCAIKFDDEEEASSMALLVDGNAVLAEEE